MSQIDSKEELELLRVIAQEDANEIKRLKTELDVVLSDKARDEKMIIELNRQVAALQDEMAKISQQNFTDQVQAKTAARDHHQSQLASLTEEKHLLITQSELDMETIQVLQHSSEEAMLARDRLAETLDTVTADRDEAVIQSELLTAHSDVLRKSNEHLAAKVAELEEAVQVYENEDHAQFFARHSKREIKAGKLLGGGAGSTRSSAPSPSMPQDLPRSAPADTMTSSQNQSQANYHSQQYAKPVTKPSYGLQSTSALYHNSQTAPRVGAGGAWGSSNEEESGHSAYSSAEREERGEDTVRIVDALSGKKVKVPTNTKGELQFTSSMGYSSPHDMDPELGPEDDDDVGDSILKDVGGPASSISTPVTSHPGSSPKKPPLPTSPGGPFATVRQMKKQAAQSFGPLGEVGPSPYSPPATRPGTCPLTVEAIYGEKGGSGSMDRLYLVKFSNVESEQWTSSQFIDADCEALKAWRRMKAGRDTTTTAAH